MALVNTEYFQGLTDQVNSCQSCAQLQALSTQSLTALNAQLAAVNAQIAAFAPLQALLSPPGASPADIVGWITGLIDDYLTPQFQPYITLQAQLPALTLAVSDLTDAINTKALQFPDCEITPP